MRIPLNTILTALFFSIPFCGIAQHPGVGKEPAWITGGKYDYTVNQLDKDAENGYVDLVYERQVSLQDQVVYMKKANDDIVCAAFKLHYEFSYTYKKIRLKCEYEALKDHVSPAETQAFYSSYKQADKEINHELSYNHNESGSSATYSEVKMDLMTQVSIVLVLIGVIATVIWRYQRR